MKGRVFFGLVLLGTLVVSNEVRGEFPFGNDYGNFNGGMTGAYPYGHSFGYPSSYTPYPPYRPISRCCYPSYFRRLINWCRSPYWNNRRYFSFSSPWASLGYGQGNYGYPYMGGGYPGFGGGSYRSFNLNILGLVNINSTRLNWI